MESPLSIFVPHTTESLLNSHHTQHFSASHLLSYELLLQASPHTTLFQCNNLNPATLLPPPFGESPNRYPMTIGHFLTLQKDLEETPLDNSELLWFTDERYLKDDSGEYYTGYAVLLPLKSLKMLPYLWLLLPNRQNFLLLLSFASLLKENVHIYINICIYKINI